LLANAEVYRADRVDKARRESVAGLQHHCVTNEPPPGAIGAQAFFFAVAVAVGLTPEMLPMIVTVCLSKGAVAMGKKKVIVKRLNAIQNLGAMDVLCTDKTGT
jgi:magnesium-transporting ATPase (P-type)